MFEAQILNNNGAVYSPWMDRGGDNLIFNVEVVDAVLNRDFRVQIFHKNSDDAGVGSGISASVSSVGTVGLVTPASPVTGLKELVRYKFYFQGASSGDWVLFRALPLVWYDDLKA